MSKYVLELILYLNQESIDVCCVSENVYTLNKVLTYLELEFLASELLLLSATGRSDAEQT